MKEKLIRFYFYCGSGETIINDFRNIGFIILGLYIAWRYNNPLVLVLMCIVALPILFTLGYVNVHHISRVRDRLNTKHGTHYAIKQFELIEEQVALLKRIADSLDKNNK